MKKTFYISTPIYYVNGLPHKGHSYTTIAADCLSRHKRSRGYDVFFLTGTDEHGQKVLKVAQEKGLTPIEFADSMIPYFKEAWKRPRNFVLCNNNNSNRCLWILCVFGLSKYNFLVI